MAITNAPLGRASAAKAAAVGTSGASPKTPDSHVSADSGATKPWDANSGSVGGFERFGEISAARENL